MRVLTLAFVLLAVLFAITTSPAQQTPTTAIPNLISYGGVLHDPNGKVLASRVVGVTFSIYKEQEGGAPLWLETQNVTPDAAGHYTVLLGSTKADGIDADLFNTQEQRWLGVQVQGQEEMPRVMLVSVPYAMKAGDAETVGGLPVSAFVMKTPSPISGNTAVTSSGKMIPTVSSPITGAGTPNYVPLWTSSTNLGNSAIYQSGSNIGIGTMAPTSLLTVAGSLAGNPVNTTTTYQVGGKNVLSTAGTQNLFVGLLAGQANSSGANNVFSGYSAGSSNTTGVANAFFGSQAGQFNVGGSNNTFLGQGSGQRNTSGIDNTFLGARVGLRNVTGNNNVFAGFVAGYSNTTGSQNVFMGNAAGTVNTIGQNNTFLGWGSGAANVTGTDNIYVGYTSGGNAVGSNNIYIGEVSNSLTESNTIRIGTTQTATYIQGVINGNGSGLTGVQATLALPFSGTVSNSQTAFTVTNQGTGGAIWGETGQGQLGLLGYYDGNSGVYGQAFGYGVIGVSTGPNDGVYGEGAIGVFGTGAHYNNGNGNGVWGESTSGSGVIGESSSGTGVYGSSNTGDAGYFYGNVSVTGMLTKGGGSFKIDHPLDPANKFLYHSFVESPDMKNVYDGIAVLDDNGGAIVQLPDWFQALNRDFRYQLTAIGRPSPGLYISREVENNTFAIAGGTPGSRVSWQVTGIRQDAFANAHRLPVEKDKADNERGYYLHPELFGAPEDKRIGYVHQQGAQRVMKPMTAQH